MQPKELLPLTEYCVGTVGLTVTDGEDGKVLDVLPGEPFSEALVSPGTTTQVRYVLELKRGIAEKAGIKDGGAIRHPVIAQTAGAG